MIEYSRDIFFLLVFHFVATKYFSFSLKCLCFKIFFGRFLIAFSSTLKQLYFVRNIFSIFFEAEREKTEQQRLKLDCRKIDCL